MVDKAIPMDKDLETKLFNEFPKLFKSIRWGIECDNGWYHLIYWLCYTIQHYIDDNKHLKIRQVNVLQIKEKYGGLRFYIVGGDELISGMIWFAEHLSETICERCGSQGAKVSNKVGWIKTLCGKCRGDEYGGC